MVHFSLELDPQYFTLESNEQQTEIYTTLDVTIDVRELRTLVGGDIGTGHARRDARDRPRRWRWR